MKKIYVYYKLINQFKNSWVGLSVSCFHMYQVQLIHLMKFNIFWHLAMKRFRFNSWHSGHIICVMLSQSLTLSTVSLVFLSFWVFHLFEKHLILSNSIHIHNFIRKGSIRHIRFRKLGLAEIKSYKYSVMSENDDSSTIIWPSNRWVSRPFSIKSIVVWRG